MNIKRKGLTVGALLLCMNLSTFAQSVKLSLKGVSVERAMTELREKSGYSFVFAAADVNTQKVINVNAKDLKQAIGQILDGQNVSYQIKGKNIVVAKGGKTSTQEQWTAEHQAKEACQRNYCRRGRYARYWCSCAPAWHTERYCYRH